MGWSGPLLVQAGDACEAKEVILWVGEVFNEIMDGASVIFRMIFVVVVRGETAIVLFG